MKFPSLSYPMRVKIGDWVLRMKPETYLVLHPSHQVRAINSPQKYVKLQGYLLGFTNYYLAQSTISRSSVSTLRLITRWLTEGDDRGFASLCFQQSDLSEWIPLVQNLGESYYGFTCNNRSPNRNLSKCGRALFPERLSLRILTVW